MSLESSKPVVENTGEDHFVDIDGMRFHYVTWGDPSLPVLVCLHGLRGYARTFDLIAHRMQDRFHVVALDQRGRGDTDWDPDRNYYTDQYVSDLERFLDILNFQKVHLLGHSMGGANALMYAGRHPERVVSLILEDSGPGAANPGSAGVARIFEELKKTPMEFADWDEASVFWRKARPNVSDAAIASRVANSLKELQGKLVWKHDQAGIAACRISPAEGRGAPDLWPSVDAVQCPALILRGANSDYLKLETAKAVCERNKRFEMHEIAAAGHYVHDDNLADFLAVVDPFLNKNSGK
ncbi:MAG: alpha/beta hydrolase [Alphaproteobacteria bacterium]|nr:alpha/beta hydrolase [Alphaproteobacteria bacterium]